MESSHPLLRLSAITRRFPGVVANDHQQLARLKAQGMAVLFISHKLDEVLAHADRITVLRGGKKVGELPASLASRERLVELMLGREALPRPQLAPPQPGVRLEVDALNDRAGRDRYAALFEDRLHPVSRMAKPPQGAGDMGTLLNEWRPRAPAS